ncbi:MAG: HlyD family efflux transporter periplasmic adaptor subunit [Chloroflexi bacterium]|nr:HlyD family efflux transporter periplasmic adaptor subunit [Chloroflexota bacterium]
MLKLLRGLVIRLLVVVALSAIAVAVIFYVRFQRQQAALQAQPVVLDETSVERGDLVVTVSATGVITPVRQVPLLFEYSAPVVEVLVQEGESVVAGQLLARLDDADLQAILQDAQLALTAAQSAYDALLAPARPEDIAAAQAALNAALAALNAAYATAPTAEQIEIARLQTEVARNQLWQLQLQRDAQAGLVPTTIAIPDGLPQEAIDAINAVNQFIQNSSIVPSSGQLEAGLNQADYGVQIADANYASVLNQDPDIGQMAQANLAVIQAQNALDRLVNGPNEFELARAELQVRQGQLAVELAQAGVERARLVAPFDGVIAENNLVVGELPAGQTAAMLLVDSSSFYVDVAIDETDVVRVTLGQSVNLFLDALPNEAVTGSVTRIAITPTRIGQLVTFPVRVTLNPTSDTVRVGMSVTARVVVNQLQDVLTLRNRFIRIDRATGQAFVTVEDESGRFTEIEIVLGLRNDTHSQIISGLSEGQRVVLVERDTLNPLR